jgi:hypothetical protein
MLVDFSAGADALGRRELERLRDAISVLQHEHDQLIPLVAEGPLTLRPLRMRQLESIAKQLIAARAEQAKLSRH